MLGRLRPSLCVLFAGLFAVSGCGKESGPALFPVRGSVFVNGKPAEHAAVSLIPVDPNDGRYPAGGFVDADGEFQLTTLKPNDGAEPGEYYVSISWAKLLNPKSSEPEYGPELLPAKYQNPATSGLQELKVVIEESENELPRFDIKL